MAKVISFVNQKGGTGKTSSSTNIAYVLKELGNKVLFIDFDGQANASATFGIMGLNNVVSIVDLLRLTEKKLQYPEKERYIFNSSCGVDVIPNNDEFFSYVKEIISHSGYEFILRKFLKKEGFLDNYDYIIIDNNPNVELSACMSIIASDYLVVPCEAEAYSFQGMLSLIKSLRSYSENEDFNCNAKIAGILITKDKSQTIVSRVVKEELKSNIDVKTFDTSIPFSSEMDKSHLNFQILNFTKHNCSIAKAYKQVTEELLCQMK